jgi:hypothetical protein
MTGPVTIFVNGNTTINGIVTTHLNLPSNFRLNVIPAATVNITLLGSYYGVVNAPLSGVTLGGSNTLDFYGSVTGKTVLTAGNVNIHNDLSVIQGGYYSPKTATYTEVSPYVSGEVAP